MSPVNETVIAAATASVEATTAITTASSAMVSSAGIATTANRLSARALSSDQPGADNSRPGRHCGTAFAGVGAS